MRRTGLCLLLLLLTPCLAGWVDPGVPGDIPQWHDFPPSKYPRFSGTFLTFFLWQNDRDFDSTPPLFDKYGQSVGYVDVRVYPRLTWRPSEAVTFRYFAEIGGALWSQGTEDESPLVESRPVYIQKELWGQVKLPWGGYRYGFRLGFQYIYDPTLLFLEKYVGAFTGFYRKDETVVRLIALQVPDTIYEGVTFNENNFQNDDFVFAADASFRPWDRFRVRPGLYFEWDRTDVDRPRYLWNPCVSFAYDFENAGRWVLDTALQAGFWREGTLDNRDMTLLAGAVQLHGELKVRSVSLETNFLVLTPDGADPNNDTDSQYAYSGFSRSRTLFLTQNWILDQYNNLDEKAAAAGAGVFIADLYAHVPVTDNLELFGVVGYGMVLENQYTLGGTAIGTEVDAGLFWQPYPNAKLIAVGGTVLPGRAGAALQNEINPYKCDPVYYFQAAFAVTF